MINGADSPVTIVNDNQYMDGKRISQQTVTYRKSDDVRALGNLHFRLADALRRIEDITLSGSDSADMTPDEVNMLRLSTAERDAYIAEIATQQEIVDGYAAQSGVKPQEETKG